MAIQVSSTTVIDNSRNLTNIVTGTISANSAGNALKITQAGAGNALLIEDVASDTTPLVVNANGQLGLGATTVAASALLELTSTTQGLLGPRMTTTQRDAIVTPATGLLIYNTTLSSYQVYSGTGWTSVGGGATGGGTDQIFWENGQTVNTPYTITDGKNAMSAGPITINSGISVTVGSGEVWTIV